MLASETRDDAMTLRARIEALIEWYGHEGHRDVRWSSFVVVSDLRAALRAGSAEPAHRAEEPR